MKAFTVLFFILFSVNIFAQKVDSLPSRRHGIIFAPLNLFDIINPNLQIGYQYRLSKRWEIQTEMGMVVFKSVPNYLIDQSQGIPDHEYNNKGYKGRIELKYLLYDRKGTSEYVSVEIFHLQNKSKVQETFSVSDTSFIYSFPRPQDANAYTEYFTKNMRKTGLNLKYGIKEQLGKGWFLEVHVGLGLAYREIEHYGRENLNDPITYPLFANNKLGKIYVLSLPWNFKIGYSF